MRSSLSFWGFSVSSSLESKQGKQPMCSPTKKIKTLQHPFPRIYQINSKPNQALKFPISISRKQLNNHGQIRVYRTRILAYQSINLGTHLPDQHRKGTNTITNKYNHHNKGWEKALSYTLLLLGKVNTP